MKALRKGEESKMSRSITDSDLMPASSTSAGHLIPSGRSRVRRLIVLCLFVLGVIICASSLICILLLPAFVTNQISKRLVLKNNSLLLERWSKPNVPMYFKVWVYDVENANEVLASRGTRPKVREIGPFVFHLKRQKDIVSFAGDNLYYTERKIYHFNQELSCCAINTTITIPNIPLVAVVDRALGYQLPLLGRFIPRLINRAIQSLREQLFVKKQVREILFDGYEVELLKMVSRVGSLVGMPQTSQRFALLKGRNNTWRPEQDGVWAINTGSKDRKQFGKVSSWNSYKKLPFWAAPACNTINGSDGTLFPPPIKRSEPLYIFNQELCRTVNLVYERPSDIRAISAYRFVLNPLNFAHTVRQRSSSGATAAHPSSAPLPPVGLSNQPPTSTDHKQSEAINANKPLPANPAGGEQQSTAAGRQQVSPHKDPLRGGASEPEVGVDVGATGRRWRNRGPQSPTAAGLVRPDQAVLAAQEAALARADSRTAGEPNPQSCFCDRKSTNLNGINVCEFDGLIELSKCTKQAQVIFGSMPHFYNGDPRLRRQVIGMEPNASKHTTYLDIEPNTGLVLGGKRRVQLNLLMKHNKEVEGFENIKDMLIPIVWFEESALIPEESAQKFRSLYTDRIRLVNLVLLTLFLASIGLIAIDLRLMAAQYAHCFRKLKISCKSAVDSGSKSNLTTSTSLSGAAAAAAAAAAASASPTKTQPDIGKRRARNLRSAASLIGSQVSCSTDEHSAGTNLADELSGKRAMGLSSPLLAESAFANGHSNANQADSSESGGSR